MMSEQAKIEELKAELKEVKQRNQALYADLKVAQEKRSGHYAKLEHQLKLNEQLRTQVKQLQEILASQNQGFLTSLIQQNIPDLKGSMDVLEKYSEALLNNAELKHFVEHIGAEKEQLQKQLNELKHKFEKLQADATLAQEKRAGHYKKLVDVQQKNAELKQKVQQLNQKLKHQRQTLTWCLGEALLKCKTPMGLLSLPYNLYQATKKYQQYSLTRKSIVASSQAITTTEVVPAVQSAAKTALQSANDNANVASGVPDISILGWPKPSTEKPTTIMAIADPFTTSNLKSVANLITPRPDNWQGLLNRDNPEMLFVESAWNGNQNSWQYRVGSYANPPGKELFEAIEGFKQVGKPTIFWNKEDPVHFDKFKNAAKEFDFIFTSDEGSIPAYQKISNAQVYALPFAADASVNNPISSQNRLNKVCFAGSYYANRFAERRDDQIMLLESALPFGLDIYDRNANNANLDFRFPTQFKESIRGALPYEQMNEAYKKYKVFLNVNSVIDSKTMFSRRVFELLASGTPIISTPSLGIEEFFGNDLVWLVKNKQEAKEAIHTLLNDEKEWKRRSLQGIRTALAHHTFADRFQFILDKAGLPIQNNDKANILWVAEIHSQHALTHFIETVKHQDTQGKFSIQPFVILRNNSIQTDLSHIVEKKAEVLTIVQQQINAQTDFVAFYAAQSLYGKNYLLDLYLADSYANAEIFSKPFNQKQYCYEQHYLPTASLFKASAIAKLNAMSNWINSKKAISSKLTTFIIDDANYLAMLDKENQRHQMLEDIEI